MNSVIKAIIPAGGFGTRFLPITRAIPKEMLPIGDKPIIHYIIQELVDAGITELLILVGRGRECLMNYFDAHPELGLSPPFPNISIIYKRVPHPRGVADCVWHAKDFVGKDRFIVAYSDNVFFNGNPTKELIDDNALHNKSVVCVVEVDEGKESKYGIIRHDNFQVREIIEKPSAPPSRLAGFGRYLLSPKIFTLIQADTSGQVCMSAQLNKLATQNELRAVQTFASAFDTGDKSGWLEANLFCSCPS